MIQVCSNCGTRWNVRDRRRVWCPRCNGTLLAPSGPDPAPEWKPTAVPGRTPPKVPPGYRWIAVRPGAAPHNDSAENFVHSAKNLLAFRAAV